MYVIIVILLHFIQGISFRDFLMLYCQQNVNRSHNDELKEVFRLLDDDNDGFVEIPKLRHVFKVYLSNIVLLFCYYFSFHFKGLMVGDNAEAQTREIINTAYPEEVNMFNWLCSV
jgi:Ca2+-binding EF-hand superfamily protein